MRAMVVVSPGPAEVLRLRELPAPECPDGYAVVSVAATGVNPVDAGNRGDPSWAGITAPYVVGYEFAGTITSLNTTTAGLHVGDEVWGLLPVRGTRWGAYAEQVAVPSWSLAPRPDELSAIQAAGLPLGATTALQTLDRLALPPGSWLLVHGAAGGVGHLLVQLAAARGIRVAAASRPHDRQRLTDRGVELWLDRASESVAAAATSKLGHGVDAVVDLVGGQLRASLPYVVEGGRAATIVDLAGDFDEAIDRNITIHGVLLRPGREVLDRLSSAVAAGLRPDIAHVWPLPEAATAHRRLEAGGVGGKIVLSMPPRS